MKKLSLLIVLALFALTSCNDGPKNETTSTERSEESKSKIAAMKLAQDNHSFSRPNDAVVTHLAWDAKVDFETKVISGTAHFDIDNKSKGNKIIFDTRDLDIQGVMLDDQTPSSWELGPEKEFMGQALVVEITPETKKVSITYASSPDAGALLWVEGEKPFLFTQSQAILARTWIPCQDSPGVRYTYEADVQVREDLMALMSASNPTEKSADGKYHFEMKQAIPSYLMALAVGDIEYRSMGPNTAVYATPDLIEAAAWEFAETEDMLVAAEALYGDYVWDRYDLLILPAAFPFGGMENPRLTFATPTIIAGDRSLTSLVAHELAHSWSGNLVTNSTWDDFWLNEGFTVYFEQRIMEAVYGRDISEMLAQLSYQGLVKEVDEIMDKNPNDTHLKLHLKDRDPDDGMSAIAYDKGYFFLRMLEENVGRSTFDAFLKDYFTSNAFSVMDTEQFVAHLKENLLDETAYKALRIDDWIYGAGLPENCPTVGSDRLVKVDEAIQKWTSGEQSSKDLPWNDWLYQERYRFLTNLPAEGVDSKMLKELDEEYGITETGNNEVLFAWLEQSILHDYQPAYPQLRSFLTSVGRRKFLTPLYRAMLETDQKDMAMSIYEEARPAYHSVATGTMDKLLSWPESE
jgi:leukotriene-A4 hydrolase